MLALILLAGLSTIMPPIIAAGTPAQRPVVDPPHQHQPPPDLATPWLEEVRAQRRAREARREAARETYEMRRRLTNPRRAAQSEAWEEDVRRRRAAHYERIEQEREMFRNMGPTPIPGYWPNYSPMPNEDHSEPGFSAAKPSLFVPQGWDNLWYFRGY